MVTQERMQEIMRVIVTQDFRDDRERAVYLVDALWEPEDGVVPDKWYRDLRVETVALLLNFGMIVLPGSNGPPRDDPRVAQTRVALLELADKLR